MNFPDHFNTNDKNEINYKTQNNSILSFNATLRSNKTIDFLFKNISITERFVESTNGKHKKQIIGINKINHDVFMIETANGLENNRFKKKDKSHKPQNKLYKKTNLTITSINKSFDKKYNNNSNEEKSLNITQTNKHPNNSQLKTKVIPRNSTFDSNMNPKIFKENRNKNKVTHYMSPVKTETNFTILEEKKNLTFDDYLESNIEVGNSLSDKINSFFLNYGNGYNNIDIPFSNFDLSKALPQEFLNQLNKTSFDYEYFYKKKENDYSFINDIGSEKLNSLYDDITQDSDFNNFIKDEYKNIPLDKLKTEEVKIRNYTKSLFVNKRNQSKELKQIKDGNIRKEFSKKIGKISLNNKYNEIKIDLNESEKPILIRNESIIKVNISNQIAKEEYVISRNNTQEAIKSNVNNYTKAEKKLKSFDISTDLQSKSYSSNTNNGTNHNLLDDCHKLNLTSQHLTNTVHFNKYKEDLKKIKDLEQILKPNSTIDNKDCLYKKIQISKELKLKNFNKTHNNTDNNSSTNKVNPITNKKSGNESKILKVKLS